LGLVVFISVAVRQRRPLSTQILCERVGKSLAEGYAIGRNGRKAAHLTQVQ
jgi:hypothetical protein